MKIFENGRTNFHWTAAKGQHARNQSECEDAYRGWWREWVEQESLLPVLQEASGLSDMFGQPGHVCQATVLWKIRKSGL